MHFCIALPESIRTVPNVVVYATLRRLHRHGLRIQVALKCVVPDLTHFNDQFFVGFSYNLNFPRIILLLYLFKGDFERIERPDNSFFKFGHVFLICNFSSSLCSPLFGSLLFLFGTQMLIPVIDIPLFIIVGYRTNRKCSQNTASWFQLVVALNAEIVQDFSFLGKS